jgi:hypothetical protein
MSVEVVSLQGKKPSSGTALPDFNASFDENNGIPEWLIGGPSVSLEVTVNVSMGISAFPHITVFALAPNTNAPIFIVPTYSDQAVLAPNMVSQYLKTVLFFHQDVGGSLRGGPVVALAGNNTGTPNTLQGYYIEFDTDVPTTNLVSIMDGTLQSNIFVPVTGDVIELQVNFAPAQNVIQVWHNAALVLTFTDVSASRAVPGGLPGFFYTGTTATANQCIHRWGPPFITRPTR